MSGKTPDIGLDDLIVSGGAEALSRLMASARVAPISRFIAELKKIDDLEENRRIFTIATNYVSLEDYGDGDFLAQNLKRVLKRPIDEIRAEIQRFRGSSGGKFHIDDPDDPVSLRRHLEIIRVTPQKELPAIRVNQYVADRVKTDMKRRGKFINFDGRIYYYQHGNYMVGSIEVGEQIRLALNERYKINKATSEYQFVMEDIEVEAKFHGESAEVHQRSYYDASKNILYLYNKPDQVFKIMEKGIDVLNNGEEGIYFRTDITDEPFLRLPTYQKDAALNLIKSFRFTPGGVTADDTYKTVKFWIEYTTFRKKNIPIPYIKGEHGSAKSSMSRLIGQIVQGLKFEVSSDFNKREDLIASICASSVMVWDNVEKMDDELINILCSVVTGVGIDLRKLYANNEMIKYKPQCAMLINARSDFFLHRRADLADRLLPIGLEPIKNKLTEAEMAERTQEVRNHFWSQFIEECPTFLKNIRTATKREKGL